MLLTAVPDYVTSEVGKPRSLLAFIDGQGAHIWQVENGQRVGATITVDHYIGDTARADGRRIAMSSSAGVTVYDSETGAALGTIPGGDLRGAEITVTGQLFVFALSGQLTMYDLDTLQPIRSFRSSRGYVQQLMSTADGSMIAVRGGDHRVTLFDVATAERLGLPIDIPDAERSFVSLSSDGRALAYGGGVGARPKLWDLYPNHWIDAACKVAGRNLTHAEWDSLIGDLAPYRLICPDVT